MDKGSMREMQLVALILPVLRRACALVWHCVLSPMCLCTRLALHAESNMFVHLSGIACFVLCGPALFSPSKAFSPSNAV